jgi:hypothetical protein
MITNPANPPRATTEIDKATLDTIIDLNAQVLGLTLGIISALGLFFATNFLILKGGEHVGATLQLLGQFFYGYKVTVLGSFIGGLYAFVVGFIAGYLIGTIYTWIAKLRTP